MIGSVTREFIAKLCSDESMVVYCCIMGRPGFHAWLVEIEYTKFKPDTDANDGFHLLFAKWPEDDPVTTMGIAVFDKSQKEFAESILWKNGLKKTAPGFVPMSIGPKGAEAFWLQGPNIFYLENHSKGGANVIYTNNKERIERARKHEMAQCQKFFDEHERWIETPEGKAIADAYWEKHPEGRVL